MVRSWSWFSNSVSLMPAKCAAWPMASLPASNQRQAISILASRSLIPAAFSSSSGMTKGMKFTSTGIIPSIRSDQPGEFAEDPFEGEQEGEEGEEGPVGDFRAAGGGVGEEADVFGGEMGALDFGDMGGEDVGVIGVEGEAVPGA